MFEELKKLKTDARALRQFAFLVGGIFAVLGFWSWWKEAHLYPAFLTAAAFLGVPGILFPAVLKPVYLAWMGLALILGAVMSRVILTVTYFIVLTPIALVMRLGGHRFLDLKYPDPAASYWIKRKEPQTNESYEKQF